MLITAIAAAVMFVQSQDAWTLKPSFDPKDPKQVWAINVDAQSQGTTHHAAFQFTRVPKSSTKDKTVVTYGWEKLAVDDQEGQDIPAWNANVGTQGQILQMEGDVEDDYRRMLSPLVFVYPDKPVNVGDKWEVDVKPTSKGSKLNYQYEANSAETVDGSATLKVTVKLKEEGESPISGTGTWWITRVGKIIKFEVKLGSWIVPMAGSDVGEVVIKGKAI